MSVLMWLALLSPVFGFVFWLVGLLLVDVFESRRELRRQQAQRARVLADVDALKAEVARRLREGVVR